LKIPENQTRTFLFRGIKTPKKTSRKKCTRTRKNWGVLMEVLLTNRGVIILLARSVFCIRVSPASASGADDSPRAPRKREAASKNPSAAFQNPGDSPLTNPVTGSQNPAAASQEPLTGLSKGKTTGRRCDSNFKMFKCICHVLLFITVIE
jgi:hypothetical protein